MSIMIGMPWRYYGGINTSMVIQTTNYNSQDYNLQLATRVHSHPLIRSTRPLTVNVMYKPPRCKQYGTGVSGTVN
jgi:hypothetical protein